MKKITFVFTIILFFFQISLSGQETTDSTGMLGDNFSLQGALELFKQSDSPEDFEKKLNQEDTYVNNLDLNEDGEIDYIRVVDNMDGDAHAMALQIAVDENESQDIAVIEMEKTGNDQVTLQIVGNEELYGEEMFVEPVGSEVSTTETIIVNKKTVVVNVWAWPSVRYVYAPRYRVWVSPWRWRHYPRYWKPWRPHPWRTHYYRRAHYHVHYHPVHIHRVHRAHRIYTPHRKTSVVVHKRSTTIKVNRSKSGKVKVGRKTTKTTTVRNKNGKVVSKSKTAKTKTVRNKNNKVVKKTKTTTKVKKGKNKTRIKKTKATTKKRRKSRR
jgi:hypothetical protein